MSIKIMKQVITTLQEIQEGCSNVVEDKLHDHAVLVAKMVRKDCDKAITALHQAIEQAEYKFQPDWDSIWVLCEERQRMALRIEELEKVQRQPLTDDEIKKIWGSYFSRGMEFARAIEAAHGIRGKE